MADTQSHKNGNYFCDDCGRIYGAYNHSTTNPATGVLVEVYNEFDHFSGHPICPKCSKKHAEHDSIKKF